jgi:hypothetical protein
VLAITEESSNLICTFASQTGMISVIIFRFFVNQIFPCSLYFVILDQHHVW